MRIKMAECDIDVLEAARQRIINVFSNGTKVYLSMSGGKDSITMADITYKLIQEGRIDPSLLTVVFIDEECMYDDVMEIVKAWRKKFLLVGANFEWYCLEVKHFNCINQLQEDETFIVYDRYAKDSWIQQPPPFAITSHPLHDPRKETYQSFLKKRTRDGISMVGVRMAESIQRRLFISTSVSSNRLGIDTQVYPIFDWKDNDVWLYLYKNHLDIPVTYLRMWQVGVPKGLLRICNFFAIDTMRCLVRMSEFDPGLMERVEKRQPNAYLAAMYFDTAFFGRSTANRKKSEKKLSESGPDENIDYHQKLIQYLYDDRNFTNDNQKKIQHRYKQALIPIMRYQPSQAVWKMMYEKLMAGDTKGRNLRAAQMRAKADFENAAFRK